MIRQLEEIKSVLIEKLDTAWPAKLRTLANFVEIYFDNGVPSREVMNEWSNRFYSVDYTENPTRLDNFMKTASSIKRLGFVTLLNCPTERRELIDLRTGQWRLMGEITQYTQDTLPRVAFDTFHIDDGRHRLAVLMALNVKETNVALISRYDPIFPLIKDRKFEAEVIKSFGDEVFREIEGMRKSQPQLVTREAPSGDF